MSERKDLTRWNRAGRSRFEYVDGNAIEYLEILRQTLAKRFESVEWIKPREVEPVNEVSDPDAPLVDEQKRRLTRSQRLQEMYHQDRKDWGWEISRTFARACHILTGYADAWANEGYLRTATQWDNVRRLVELLDYHPAPPASATTPLVLIAKKGKSGTVAKGFQVKNRPPQGKDKVIFETLEDLNVDSQLNELRPVGYDQSEKPAVDTPATGGERMFSALANLEIVNLQGIGTLVGRLHSKGIDLIKDFYDAEPEDFMGPGIRLERAWEFKAKAMTVCNFNPGSEWEMFADKTLLELVSEDPDALAETSGNPLPETKAFQLAIAMLGVCLDHEVYSRSTLSQLMVPVSQVETSYILSAWRAGKKPKVEAGQVALVYRPSTDEAEAVTIAKVDKKTSEISVISSPLQYSWSGWPISDAVLRVVPRWTRTAWLNGSDVIRTEEVHGLAAGNYVCWRDADDDKVYHYAAVLETDKHSLRLKPKVSGDLPYKGAEIMVALPVTTGITSRDSEVLNAAEAGVDVVGVELSLPEADLPFHVYKAFQIEGAGGGGGGLLPPASLPGLGSFLFPSPLLPIDLVKAALELLLSLGIMVIPSTGEIVFKGMPFGGLLQGASNIGSAAEAMVQMLENIQSTAMWHDGWLVEQDDDTKPVYIEAVCDSAADINGAITYVNASGSPATGTLSCSNGKIVDHSGQPVGFQPHYSHLGIVSEPADGTKFQVVKWRDASTKIDDMQILLQGGQEGGEPSVLFQGFINSDSGTPVTSVASLPEPLLAVLKGQTVVKGTVVANAPTYLFSGVPDKIEPEDWVAALIDDAYYALQIENIDDYNLGAADKAFSLGFKNLPGDPGALKKIFADFRSELIADGASFNDTALGDEITLHAVPESLTIGRTVLLDAGGEELFEATITSIHGDTIKTEPSAKGIAKGSLKIYGNVVKASHGVAKPVAVLGSGDATKTHQAFVLEVEGVSFTPDATKGNGVAAAIDVEVAGRIWEQVSSLRDSAPGDHHYVVRMTEDGFIKIQFGDGQYGRRLPSGKNNVKIRYRVGTGLTGNLSAYSLDSAVKPHSLIDSVMQPVVSSGGGDMEAIESLKSNAPSTLLALERAVSLTDFADLATGRSNVWQASARKDILHTNRQERVIVTIVPAGGVTSADVRQDVTDYLQAHALPNIEVIVEDFHPVMEFDLNVLVRLDSSAYLSHEVVANVTHALVNRFTLENAKLGDHLYLSEIYKTVEGITGVENSICDLLQDGVKKALIRANGNQDAIYLDSARLVVDWEEYSI